MATTDKSKAEYWRKFFKKNRHYHNDIQSLTLNIIPEHASLLVVGSRGGELLAAMPNKVKVGVEFDESLYKYSVKINKKIKIFNNLTLLKKYKVKKFDYVLIDHAFSELRDIQKLISDLKVSIHKDSRIVVTFFNYSWKPLLDFVKLLKLRMPEFQEPNWLTENDIDNFFYLEGLDKVKGGKRFLFPVNWGGFSRFINRYVAQLPLINNFCLTNFSIYRNSGAREELSASVIIPARNEEGHIIGVLKKIPKFAKKIEIVFVEGNSRDNTYQAIKKEIGKYKGPFSTKLIKQKGKGKGDAVRVGFSKAKNELLIILDADLTVDPKELVKFYRAAIENRGDLIMGSRLIYPMEKEAMRTLNVIGNRFFSSAFSYLLGTRIKDTLCGTKVLLKRDYNMIARNRNYFGDFDPFGDYDLIFGAAKLNLKIVEIPIRYKERTYGKTNISRFTHGWLLLKMCFFAANKLKFI